MPNERESTARAPAPDAPAAERSAIPERLAEVADLLPGAVYLFRRGPDGSYSVPYASGRIEELFDVPAGHATGDFGEVLKRVNPDDLGPYRDSVERSARDLAPWRHEFRVVHGDGTVRWLAGQATPRREEDGGVLWHGYVSDVTERRELHERMRTRTATLRQVTDALHDVVVRAGPDGTIDFVTPSLRTVLGLDPDDAIGMPVASLFDPSAEATVERMLAEGARRPVELRGARPDGRDSWLDVSCRTLPDDTGGGAVLACRDVTRRVADRRDLQRQATLRRTLIETTNEMLAASLGEDFYPFLMERAIAVVPDAEAGSMVFWNAQEERYRFVAAQGFDLEVLRSIPLTPAELGRSDPPRVVRIHVHDTEGRLSPEKLARFAHAGNLDRIKMTLSVPIETAGRLRGYLNLDNFRDREAFGPDAIEVAELLTAQVGIALQRLELERSLRTERARYRHLADHDPLTDLPNRRLFQDRLAQALKHARRRNGRVALVYVDLDAFKAVNDRYGHALGDALLTAVAGRLQEGVREEDTVARLGGDEFAVVLADVSGSEAAETVERKLRAAVERPLDAHGVRLRPRASVGFALHPDDGGDGEALMRAADAAMYRAKQERRSATRSGASPER